MNKSASDNFINHAGAASLEEEMAIGNLMSSLKKEIRELHFQLEDEKEAVLKTNKTWKLDVKVRKLDEKIEAYETSLQSELSSIDRNYDVKVNNTKLSYEQKRVKLENQLNAEIERLKIAFESKLNTLREYEQKDIQQLEECRVAGKEGKTKEYDTYILKREQEKKSFMTDKDDYLENVPDKVSNIKKRRLLKQKIDDYNKVIQRHNAFFSRKKNPDLLLKENYGLDFLTQPPAIVHKPLEEKKVEEQKVEEKKVTFQEEPKKEQKKIDPEYEAFRKKYKAIHGEDLPEEPTMFGEEEESKPANEYVEPMNLPVIQSTKQKKIPKMVKA